MNKCKKCGMEFEGKFCPECGHPLEKRRISVFTLKSPESARTRSILFATYRLIKYLPEILFLLYGLMAFGFLAAPVATVPSMGGLFGLDNIKNIYNAVGAEGIDGIRNPAIAQLAFTAVGMVFAFVSIICANRLEQSSPLAYGFFAFYLVNIVIDSVMIANIATLDGGMGFVSAGACPICFIVFSILFAAGHAASLVFCKTIEKSLDLSAVTQEKIAERERYYAAHEKKLSVVYKIVKYLPEALFLLMSGLAFAFLAAPVTGVSDMGLFMGAADVGSAYGVVSVEGIDGLRGPAIAFMAFAVLGVIYSLYLVFVNLPDLKNGFDVKPMYTAIGIYLAYIVIGSVMAGETAALDQGMGMLSAGACPVCFIVFSILFAGVTVAALILREKLGATIKAQKNRNK